MGIAAAAVPLADPEPVDEHAEEQALRAALADAADPTGPALALADWLAAGERHEEALRVVEQALRAPVPPSLALRCRAAALHRDLGQRPLAFDVLRAAWTSAPFGGLPAAALLELAELAWLVGEPAVAQVALAELRVHPGAVSLDRGPSGEPASAELGRALAVGAAPELGERDRFGDLRGGPVAARRAAFAGLCSGDPAGPVAQRAVAIACSDPDPELRAAAVGRVQLLPEAWSEFAALALADPEPAVRLAAAARLPSGAGAAAAPWLCAALSGETAPAVFRGLHEALRELHRDGPELPPGGEHEPRQRAALAASWRAWGSR